MSGFPLGAAQAVLAVGTRPETFRELDRRARHSGRASSGIDLRGEYAVLTAVDLSGCEVRDRTFDEMRLGGTTRFLHTVFTGDVTFAGSCFAGHARFREADFRGAADFTGATFAGPPGLARAWARTDRYAVRTWPAGRCRGGRAAETPRPLGESCAPEVRAARHSLTAAFRTP